MKDRRLTCVIFFPFLLFSLAVWTPGVTAAERTDIQFMTSSPGGTWFLLGAALSEIIQKRVPDVSMSVGPGGAITNAISIDTGRGKMAMVHNVIAIMGWQGQSPFEKPTKNIRWFVTMGRSHLHFVTLKSANIRSLGDLKGKRLATLIRGNLGELAPRWALEAYGVTYANLAKVSHGSFSDGLNQLRDGHVDAFAAMIDIPAGSVQELASTRAIQVLPLPDDKLAFLAKKNSGFLRAIIPAKAYNGVDEPVPTAQVMYGAVVAANVSESLVHQMAKAVVDDAPKFINTVAANKWMTTKDLAMNPTLGVVPHHPGAEKLYRERGLIN